MKNLVLLLAIVSFCSFVRADQSGPGNGTDYVKVLFAEAQYNLLKSSVSINDAELAELPLAKELKDWLSQMQGSETRFAVLKRYLRTMELRFQSEPCTDFTKRPASICFFDDEPLNPYVVISLEENKLTTREQAAAMLIHEAGHFVGEKDHLFLDRLGVQLENVLRTPNVLIAEAQSKELVANPFAAKEACDAGQSAQAKMLKAQVSAQLVEQCRVHNLACDLEKIEFTSFGETHFEPGIGIDMNVRCSVRGLLNLKP